MSTWKYIDKGVTSESVDTATIQNLINQGKLNGESLLWKEGAGNWMLARSFPEFTIPGMPSGSAPAVGVPPVPPASIVSDAEDISKNKVFAVLAYIGILFLVPLLAAPNSKFARYHTNQGLVLFLATIVTGIGSAILTMIPFIGCVAWILPFVVMIGSFALMVIGIINAANGEYKPLPLIGHFELIK